MSARKNVKNTPAPASSWARYHRCLAELVEEVGREGKKGPLNFPVSIAVVDAAGVALSHVRVTALGAVHTVPPYYDYRLRQVTFPLTAVMSSPDGGVEEVCLPNDRVYFVRRPWAQK